MDRDYVLKPFRSSSELNINYEAELNEQQYEAVTSLPGPALVIAGAGAGKTRTLIYRVAFLLEQGIPANRILLLTFTNKSAREMMKRVAELLGRDSHEVWGGTFHGIGNRILRRHAREAGFEKDFTIMDREDAEQLISACIGESEIDIKATRFPKPDVIASILSLSINKQLSLGEILKTGYDYFLGLTDQIQRVCDLYQKRKKTGNLMDFDDLLVLWLRMLKENEEFRSLYQSRFQFILVDEYQDTNRLQAEIIEILAARHKNVMAVGDDSQSIYSWRGAHFKNILDFPKQYPGARVFKIETNYRSSPEILSLANACIRHNAHQFDKTLKAIRPELGKPIKVECMDSRQQAAFIAQRMLELRDQGVPLMEMVVLYRSHYHALELQIELTQRNIPFTITSGIRFFEQAHIKDVLSFIRLLCNPRDEIAFKRIVRLWRGIGGKTASKLWGLFQSELDKNADPPVRPSRALLEIQRKAPAKSQSEWQQWAATMGQLESPDVRGQTGRLIEIILEAVYSDQIHSRFTNAKSRIDDLQQVIVYSKDFDSPEDFLSQLALETNADTDSGKDRESDDEKVRLSTIHQAKGLEYRIVFVIMLCEGLFPSSRSVESEDGEEEERRLFYVAVTRAKDELYLLHPVMRMSYGGGPTFQQPSRFLLELPEAAVDRWEVRPPRGW